MFKPNLQINKRNQRRKQKRNIKIKKKTENASLQPGLLPSSQPAHASQLGLGALLFLRTPPGGALQCRVRLEGDGGGSAALLLVHGCGRLEDHPAS